MEQELSASCVKPAFTAHSDRRHGKHCFSSRTPPHGCPHACVLRQDPSRKGMHAVQHSLRASQGGTSSFARFATVNGEEQNRQKLPPLRYTHVTKHTQ